MIALMIDILLIYIKNKHIIMKSDQFILTSSAFNKIKY